MFHIDRLVLELARFASCSDLCPDEVAENHQACVKTTGAALARKSEGAGPGSYVIDGRYFAKEYFCRRVWNCGCI
jgi:hypothetical protein